MLILRDGCLGSDSVVVSVLTRGREPLGTHSAPLTPGEETGPAQRPGPHDALVFGSTAALLTTTPRAAAPHLLSSLPTDGFPKESEQIQRWEEPQQ